MVNKYILKLFFLLFIFYISTTNQVAGQERDYPDSEYEHIKEEARTALKEGRIQDYIELAGIYDVLDYLEPSYCSDIESVELIPNDDFIDGNTAELSWKIEYEPEDIIFTDAVEKIGSGLDAQFFFYPGEIDEEYHVSELKITVTKHNEGGFGFSSTSDGTVVLTAPEVYELTGPEETCSDTPVDIVLSGSEDGLTYRLYRDGVQQFNLIGDGEALVFENISESGIYIVEAANLGNSCNVYMDGEVELVVHPLPKADPQSEFSSYCEGSDIQLYAGVDDMTEYEWIFPDGTISSEQNPLIEAANADVHSGEYTLTVIDENGCVSESATLNILVYSTPEVSFEEATYEICEGGLA
ncbi:hypothetical protein QA597_08655, partial [Marinilabiliaceae bacterium ANBcel2]|nr:hypothetical protein [Marinilabiliaceae bacterium ANBcel2]